MSVLQLNNVSKSYGHGARATRVLRDINLTIEEGEFVAIVGLSGTGKSTLISLMAGLISPDTGEALAHGAPISGPGPDRAIVFQNYSLLPWLSVYENVALAVDQIFREWTAAKRKEHTLRHIEMVNLTPALQKRPKELSGGMRQRVSVARALAADPKILLLDEPLSALDALTRAKLQDEISQIWRQNKKTVVLITNDPDEGIYLADRIIPLTVGPGATLGPSIRVDIPRPRNRKELNHDDRFKAVRKEIIDFLWSHRAEKRQVLQQKLTLPDIEPENLDAPRTFIGRRPPVRRSEIKREHIEMS